MLTPLHCIALRAVPVSDSRTLLSAWSRECGSITLAFPAGAGREARRRRALSSPMALFEGCCDMRPGREVVGMRDFMPSPGSPALAPLGIAATVQASFLGEMLDAVLRRCAPDQATTDFIFSSARLLAVIADSAALANFHIVFLLGLASRIGIAPDLLGYTPGMVFDMREGSLRASAPLHHDYLDPDETQALTVLVRLTFRTMHLLRLARAQRRRVLDAILAYYTIHLGDFAAPRTPQFLASL